MNIGFVYSAHAEPQDDGDAKLEAVSPGAVEPLDVWEKIDQPKVQKSLDEALPKEEADGKPGDEEQEKIPSLESFSVRDESEVDDDEEGTPGQTLNSYKKRVVLSDKQRTRLFKARKALAKSAWRFQKKQSLLAEQDPRGERELRLCTAELNDYGLWSEVSKLNRRITQAMLKAKESNAVSTIAKSACDVVGIQGIISRSPEAATSAMERLAQKLKRKTDQEWKPITASTIHKKQYLGALVRKDGAEILDAISHTDKLLPRSEKFETRKFQRTPLELQLRVRTKTPSRSAFEEKIIKVLVFDFANDDSTDTHGLQAPKMQMAEALRKLSTLQEGVAQMFDDDETPITVVMGDANGDRFSVASRILQGTLRLSDFGQDGHCELKPDQSFSCDPPPGRGKQLLGLTYDSALYLQADAKSGSSKKMRGLLSHEWVSAGVVPVPRNPKQRSEIYVSVENLKYFSLRADHFGVYSSGVTKLENGLQNSPLVWVDLNW